MNTIFSALRDGTAKDRLAIVADLAGVVGVSVAAVVGLIVTSADTARMLTFVGNLFYTLIAVALLSVALAIAINATQHLNERYKSSSAVRILMFVCLWSSWAAFVLFSGLYYAKLIKMF
jgi:hypothetical protein